MHDTRHNFSQWLLETQCLNKLIEYNDVGIKFCTHIHSMFLMFNYQSGHIIWTLEASLTDLYPPTPHIWHKMKYISHINTTNGAELFCYQQLRKYSELTTVYKGTSENPKKGLPVYNWIVRMCTTFSNDTIHPCTYVCSL